MVEIGASISFLCHIKCRSHTRVAQLAQKMVALCMDHRVLISDMYLLAIWADLVPRAEEDAIAAKTIMACNLQHLFDDKVCATNKYHFPTDHFLDMPIAAYLHHLGIWEEVWCIAGLPTKS